MWNVLGAIGGALFLGALALFGWWMHWEEEAKAHEASVIENIKQLQSFWQRQGQPIKLSYSDVEAQGFPANLRVRVRRPNVTTNVDGKAFTIAATYVDFVPEGDITEPYRVRYLQDARAVLAGDPNEYFLYLNPRPGFWLRKIAVNGQMPAAFNSYGVTLPEKILLKVDYRNKTRPISFNPRLAGGEILWRPMPTQIQRMMGVLVYMLQSSTNGL